MARIDGCARVTAQQVTYTSDVRQPGMLHATDLRSPQFDARAVAVDGTATEAMAGMPVV